MCGIYLTNIERENDELRNDLKKIVFRGPDNLTINKYDLVTIAHLRLSIIDLEERSNQPFQFENLVITYNGEIYNFKELKKELESIGYNFITRSDTEVLLKAYHAWGVKMLQKLNGMFAFAIYDILNGKVFCSRDRMGQKPFYYYWNSEEGHLEICSSPRAMTKASKFSQNGINIYLEAGYIPSPHSIYENISKLEAGNYLVVDIKNKKLLNESYWDLKSLNKRRKISFEKAKLELNELIEDAIRLRMVSDVDLGCFLSGGIDSSIIAAVANIYSENKLNTYTVKFTDKSIDESEAAHEISEKLKTNHKTFLCSEVELISNLDDLFIAYDEPFSDPAIIPTLMLCKKVKNQTTVCLSGDGGDESFMGYNHFNWLRLFKHLFIIPIKLRKLIVFILKPFFNFKHFDYLKNIFNLKSKNDFIVNIFLNFIAITKKPYLKWLNTYDPYFYKSNSIFQQTADINIKLWLEGNSNVKVDRAGMFSSIEIRNPFLDYRIIEFARELPLEFKFKRSERKIILKELLKKFLKNSIINKPKKGFSVPISKWINEPLKKDVESMLSEKELMEIPNLNYKKVLKYLKLHFDHKADFSHIIWRIYVLKKWMKLNM